MVGEDLAAPNGVAGLRLDSNDHAADRRAHRAVRVRIPEPRRRIGAVDEASALTLGVEPEIVAVARERRARRGAVDPIARLAFAEFDALERDLPTVERDNRLRVLPPHGNAAFDAVDLKPQWRGAPSRGRRGRSAAFDDQQRSQHNGAAARRRRSVLRIADEGGGRASLDERRPVQRIEHEVAIGDDARRQTCVPARARA